MFLSEAQVRALVPRVAAKFPSFGGGRWSQNNPLSQALKDEPVMFAAGVVVAEVIREVVKLIPEKGK